MIDATVEVPILQNIECRNFQPRLVPLEEVRKTSEIDFKTHIDLETSQVEQFIQEHVRVVRVGEIDVTIIDQEHEEYKGKLNPVLKAYLNSPRTKTAVVEYFLPELQRNAPNFPDFINKIGNVNDLYKEGKGTMFMDIAEEMKNQGKTISCVDIANKLSYEAYYAAMKMQALPLLSTLFPQIPFSPAERLLLATVLPLVSWGGDELLEGIGKGIYNKEKLSHLENLCLSMEDGRRIYAAKGLELMAKDYNKEFPSKSDSERSQIVVVYPKAHATRIANYMTSESLFTAAAKFAKKFLYHLPNLDYSYRTYLWKDMLAKFTNNPELASWQLVTTKKIPLVK